MNEVFCLFVCGSRCITDYQMFSRILDKLLSERIKTSQIHIVTGDARGVDGMARFYANQRGFQLHVFKAEWDKFGKSAGYKRNEVMIDYLTHNFANIGCFAMWDGQSKGTQHSINRCKQLRIPLRICNLANQTKSI